MHEFTKAIVKVKKNYVMSYASRDWLGRDHLFISSSAARLQIPENLEKHLTCPWTSHCL